ncbi:MAG: hypothetical protein E3J45_02500 [Candidatus Zixiibacteriota bacterium]|nr:MAG: hypothetical protein E3J45_02500 [candidate division Zixibacteria bacterium]
MSGQKGSRQKELESQGWSRRFISEGERLKEAVEMYESIGFEVHLEPVIAGETEEECDLCFEVEDKTYYTIYTRPLKKERH